jgi:poly-gamma-glutamate system protein
MKKIYWRPHKVSRLELILVALMALGGMTAVETMLVTEQLPFYKEKIEAARLARDGFQALKAEKTKWTGELDAEVDPAQTGMLGTLMTPITTNRGYLPAKQTSVNPNYAALVVHYLTRLELQEGDVVAVGVSGSFPAINVAVYAALEALKLRPIVISSASASQFGANDPDFTWLDMERVLYDRGITSIRSVAVSRGGLEDRALALPKEGRRLLDAAIERSRVPALRPKSYEESVNQRMLVYKEHAGDAPIKAYVNIGGGTASVGTKVGKRMFRPGINRYPPRGVRDIDSVMTRFTLDGVPVVHLIRINDLADRYGFPLNPASMPAIGQGRMFVREGYNKLLALGVIAAVLGALIAFIRRDWGFRIFKVSSRPENREPPEQMV